jgi:hypothetical protein
MIQFIQWLQYSGSCIHIDHIAMVINQNDLGFCSLMKTRPVPIEEAYLNSSFLNYSTCFLNDSFLSIQMPRYL